MIFNALELNVILHLRISNNNNFLLTVEARRPISHRKKANIQVVHIKGELSLDS